MWPDRVSNPGPLTYESGALPIALRGPACSEIRVVLNTTHCIDGFQDVLFCLRFYLLRPPPHCINPPTDIGHTVREYY